MVFKQLGVVSGVYVIGDSVKIKVEGTLTHAVLTLMGCYFVFDVTYPKVHQSILGALQHLVLQKTLKNGSKKCNFFINKIENLMNEFFDLIRNDG